jgi:hypothetical protein
MSMRTTFFVATAGEALTMELPAGLADKTLVESKNITPDIVGDLDFLLTDERTREPGCLREEENAVVFRLDSELVSSLADLDDEQIPGVAEEWRIYDTPGTIDFLAELRALARTAQARDEEMFLCF